MGLNPIFVPTGRNLAYAPEFSMSLFCQIICARVCFFSLFCSSLWICVAFFFLSVFLPVCYMYFGFYVILGFWGFHCKVGFNADLGSAPLVPGGVLHKEVLYMLYISWVMPLLGVFRGFSVNWGLIPIWDMCTVFTVKNVMYRHRGVNFTSPHRLH